MLGKIESFDVVNGNWGEYIEILQQFFIVNDLNTDASADKRRAILLSSIGPKAYSLLRDLCAPALPGTKTFDVLKELMSKHLNPQPLIIAERFKFHKRDQLSSESISQYVASLNKLTEFCKFEAFREEALRDRFVCGLKSVNIQKELLSKEELTFVDAVRIAIALESAESNAVELQANLSSFSNINKVKHAKINKGEGSKSTRPKNKIVCYCCGVENHKSNVCKYKNKTCETCKKIGHLSKMCGKIPVRNRNQTKPSFRKSAKHLCTNSSNNSDSDSDEQYAPLSALSVGHVNNETFAHKPWFITMFVKNKKLKLEFDSGTEATIFPSNWYDEYFSDKELLPTKVKLTTWSNEKIKPRGVIMLKVTLNGVSKQLRAIIARDNFQPLCGREWISALNLNWHDYVS